MNWRKWAVRGLRTIGVARKYYGMGRKIYSEGQAIRRNTSRHTPHPSVNTVHADQPQKPSGVVINRRPLQNTQNTDKPSDLNKQSHLDHTDQQIEVERTQVETQHSASDVLTAGSIPNTRPAESKPQTADKPKFHLKDVFALLGETFQEWNKDKAPQLAAALAYYTIFSLAPLLIIAIAVAGAIFGDEIARGEVMRQMQRTFGEEGAILIQSMIEGAARRDAGTIATIIGVVTLLTGAAGVFGQLKAAMNTIWDVPERPGPTGIKAILNTLKQQLVSIGFVLGGGFLLLASLLISALLAGLDSVLTETLPFPPVVIQIVHLIVSFGIVTMLFAAIFKLMPDAQIAWRDVLIGAAITSILFSVGRQLIGLYLGNSSTTSTYGAAGSLVVILIWIFYSAQILFLGAEFTQVYAKKYGSKIRYWGQPDSA